MKKKNILKSEKFVNDDGSYITKEVFKEPDNNVLSTITTYNKNKQPISGIAYSDNNFQNLYFTANFEHKKNKSYTQFVVYETKQDNLWQSILCKINSKGKIVKTKQFYDNNFEKPYIEAKRKYNKNGGYIEKVKEYSSRYSAIREYSKNNKLKSEFTYKDLNFNLLSQILYIKFYKNGSYQLKKIYVNKDSCISTYNNKKQLLLYQLYRDTNFKQAFSKTEYEYKDNQLIKEISTYHKKDFTYTDTYKYNKSGQKTEERSFINGKLSYTNKWKYLLKEGKIIHTQYNSLGKIVSKNEYSNGGKIFVYYNNGKISKIASIKNTDKGLYYNEQFFDTQNAIEYPSIIRFYTGGEFPYIKKCYTDNNFEKLYSEEKTKYFKNGKQYIYTQYCKKVKNKNFMSDIREYDKNGNLIKIKLYKDKNFKKLLQTEYQKN